MNNPIIQRELIGMLRTRRALVVQVLLIGLLAVLVILRWPNDARVAFSGTQAQQVMQLFGYGLMVALILLAPVFPATSIVLEKQRRTLPLLLNSPLTPWAIFFGKLVGVIGFIMLMLLLSLPAAGACYVMGGIDPGQIAQVYLILILLAVQYAVLGLLVSSYAATTDSALRMTYGIILILAIVTLGPKQFRQGLGGPLEMQVVEWIRCISPLPAMMQAMGHSAVGSQGLVTESNIIGRFALVAVVSSVAMALFTAFRFNQKMLDRSRAQGVITDERSAAVRGYRRIMYLWFFDPQRRSGLIGFQFGPFTLAVVGSVVFSGLTGYIFKTFPLTLLYILPGATCGFLAVLSSASVIWLLASVNPVAVKEQKCRKFGRAHWILRLFGFCLILSMALVYFTATSTMDWGVSTLGAIVVLLQIALIILVTPSLASGLIAGEIESGGWQLLQMTSLRAPTIIMGKLVSAGLTLLMMLMATMPAYAVLIFIDENQANNIIMTLISLGLTALLALLFTAAVSSLVSRTAVATTIAYACLVTLCAGTMLFWLGEDAPFSRSTVEMVLKVNPLATALTLIEAPGFAHYRLAPDNWFLMLGACVVSVVVLLVRTWQLTRPR